MYIEQMFLIIFYIPDHSSGRGKMYTRDLLKLPTMSLYYLWRSSNGVTKSIATEFGSKDMDQEDFSAKKAF